jgi:predicted negative regulator of RcsB-dependent stress response
MRKQSAALFMLALALVSLTAHFIFGWRAYQQEQQDHNATILMSAFLVTWGRDVFENLQSEFLQLFFQFMLLAGAFKFIGVKAYEEDQEELKQRLDQIGRTLKQRDEDAPTAHANGNGRTRSVAISAQSRSGKDHLINAG